MTLLKALKESFMTQEQVSEILQIIKDKNVDFAKVRYCDRYQQYNKVVEYTTNRKLNEHEFELLKRLFE